MKLNTTLPTVQDLTRIYRTALESIVALDLGKTLDGKDDFYTGPDRFFQSYLIARKALDDLDQACAAASREQPSAPPPIVAVVDGRCGCAKCKARTEDIYRMIGVCYNCGAKPILMLFRAGDTAADKDCPVCGKWNGVHSQRLASADEIPDATLRSESVASHGPASTCAHEWITHIIALPTHAKPGRTVCQTCGLDKPSEQLSALGPAKPWCPMCGRDNAGDLLCTDCHNATTQPSAESQERSCGAKL